MSSYFIASNVYSPHLGKAAIVDAGWPGQPPLFPAQVASKQKHIPGEKLNRIYVSVRDNVYELRMSKESVLPASCSVNVLSQCPSMWAFRVEIPPSHKLLPLTRLLYVCCKSCFKSRLCTCSRTGKPKLGTWGKSRPLSVRKELQKLFRTVHTKDSKAWYHLSMLDEILSALFRILVNMFVLEQENRLTLGSADCRGKILTDRIQSCRLSNKD